MTPDARTAEMNVPPPDAAALLRIAGAKGWMLDVDGCIVRTSTPGGDGGTAINGAVELVRWLKERGKSVIICTNASHKTPAHYASHLRRLGFAVDDDEVMTAATAGAAYIASQYGQGPVIVVGDVGLKEALKEAGVRVGAREAEPPRAVIVGAADHYATADLNAACLAIADGGAAFYVTVNVPWFHGGIAKSLCASAAMARAIESITGVAPVICGKPSAPLSEVLCQRLGCHGQDVVIVGDVAAIEVKMARDMGANSVLVLSGGTTFEEFQHLPAQHRPDVCVADVGRLLEALKKTQQP